MRSFGQALAVILLYLLGLVIWWPLKYLVLIAALAFVVEAATLGEAIARGDPHLMAMATIAVLCVVAATAILLRFRSWYVITMSRLAWPGLWVFWQV